MCPTHQQVSGILPTPVAAGRETRHQDHEKMASSWPIERGRFNGALAWECGNGQETSLKQLEISRPPGALSDLGTISPAQPPAFVQ